MSFVSDDWIRRLSTRLDRGDEIMDRTGRALERNSEAFNRNAEAFDRNAEAFRDNKAAFERLSARLESDRDDARSFMQELILRVERMGREQLREMRRQHDEVMHELHAQSGALLAILDRLPPGNSGSTA